jgi:hypothetical protein
VALAGAKGPLTACNLRNGNHFEILVIMFFQMGICENELIRAK